MARDRPPSTSARAGRTAGPSLRCGRWPAGAIAKMGNGRSSGIRRLLSDVRTAAQMPRVEIVLSRGREDEDAVLRWFRSRHPRYKLVGSKTVGVALLPLDDFANADDYLAGRRHVRKRARRASRMGYSVELFDPVERQSDLLAIHSSLPERQGQPIDPDYLDPHAVPRRGPNVDYLGVLFDRAVVAYSRLDYLGDIAGLGRIMGHGDHLQNGVMPLLMAAIVDHVKSTRPQARYLFYDMFFGAPDGLRAFKTIVGFRPYYVHWKREAPEPRRGP
jgi:hypothetical protein